MPYADDLPIRACTHKSGSVIDVRFTPDATKLLRSSEMTRCAIRGRPTRSDQKTGHHPGSRCASWMRPINQFVGKICFFHWGPDRGAVNPEMINAPMWLAKAKTMLVANGFRRSKDAARAGRSSRAAPNSLKTRIRDGTIGKTMPAALGNLLTHRQPRAECNG